MLVSIIITTKNEERNIEECLKSVTDQLCPAKNIEIIVVDNNSTDKTRDIVHEFQKGLAPLNLKIFNGGPERSAQKNFGVEKSTGEFFLHLDADMVLGKEAISECVAKIQANKDIVALYIPEIVRGKGFWGKVRNFERSFYDGTVVDGVRFIKKDAFEKVGGFDENLYACEDWDLDKRLKKIGKFGIIKAVLYHNETEFSLKKYLAKKGYYSKNFDAYIRKWGKNDPDIRKQFGFYYRFFKVFTEDGKWKKILQHPLLTIGVYFLRTLVGIKYLTK